MKQFIILLLFAGCVVFTPLLTHASTFEQSTVQGPLYTDTLQDVHTLTAIDEYLYLINHKKKKGISEKKVYRLTKNDPETVSLLLTAQGSMWSTDRIFKFGDDLYVTITGKKGEPVTLHRSSNNGTTWSELPATIGFTAPKAKNVVTEMFATSDRLYVVIEFQKPGRNRKVGVWSTTDGVTWAESLIEERSATYQGFVLFDDIPYILVNWAYGAGRTKKAAAVFSPSQPNGTQFQQVTYTNLHEEAPLRVAQQVVSYKDMIFVNGYEKSKLPNNIPVTKASNIQSLWSTNGMTWKETIQPFSRIVPHAQSLFAQNSTGSFYSSDGINFSGTTFNFEDDVSIVDQSLMLYASADSSILLAQFLDKKNAHTKRCLVSQDALEWFEDIQCRTAIQDAPRQVVQFGNFWYFVRGREQSSYKLFRFSL